MIQPHGNTITSIFFFWGGRGEGQGIKSVYETSDLSGRSVSYFLQHEVTRNNLYSTLDVMLVYCRVTPSVKSAITHLHTWVERGTVRVCNVLPNNTTHCPWLGLKPRPINQEISTLTIRAVHLVISRAFKYYSIHEKSSQQSYYQSKWTEPSFQPEWPRQGTILVPSLIAGY